MKYLIYEKDQIKDEMIYCNKNGNETAEDIARAIVSDVYVGPFMANEHTSLTAPIKNDCDMFIIRDLNGHDNIWQICGKISDYTGFIIPNLYKVRKIGIMFS